MCTLKGPNIKKKYASCIMTGCGKTYCLLKMLENKYKNHFDYIFFHLPNVRIQLNVSWVEVQER